MKKFIILCIALFATPAIAQTINWYVDNEIYQITTCSGGDDVTPPSAPARRGYTFTGWRDTSIIIGTWAQSGSPTPDNPTYPTFYQDGDLILRAVGSGNDFVADIYSASTGIITRRIGVKVFDGTEEWRASDGSGWYTGITNKKPEKIRAFCTHYQYSSATMANAPDKSLVTFTSENIGIKDSAFTSADDLKQFLADQYAAGTPVTIYYQLATPTLENYTPNANLE